MFIDKDIEDAYICYRCAKNFVCGGGLVYTPGEVAEGVTNLSWTLMLAGLYRSGLDMEWAGRLLTLVFSGALFWALRGASRRLFGADEWRARIPLLAVVCATHLTASFGNMLEGAAYAFALTALLWSMAAGCWPAMSLAAIFAMTLRPEGIFVAVFAGVWLIHAACVKRVSWRAVLGYMAFTECALLALILFRFQYYGDIVPNTLRAKGPGDAFAGGAAIFANREYTIHFLRYLGVGMLLFSCAGLVSKAHRSLVAWALFVVALSGAEAALRGDWMCHFRLMTPYFPLLACAAAAGFTVWDGLGKGARRVAWAAMAVSLGLLALPTELAKGAALFSARRFVPKFVADPAHHLARNAITPSLTNWDLAWPDDLFVIDWAGGDGWLLDGVPAIEICGLTDRAMNERFPGLQDRSLVGVHNWNYLFERKVSGFFLINPVSAILAEIALVPHAEEPLRHYVVIHGKNRRGNNLLLRADRSIVTALMKDAGDFCPADEYLSRPVSSGGADPLTPWQQVPWESESETFAAGWQAWGGIERVGVAVPIAAGTTVLRRALFEAAPIVLMAGLMPGNGLEARVSVYAEAGAERRAAGTLYLAGNASSEAVTLAEILPKAVSEDAAALTLEIACDAPGILYLAAYRWVDDPLPVLPSSFVRERWRHGVAYCEKYGMPEEAASAREALAAFEERTDADIEGWIARKTEVFAGAYRARSVLRNHPRSADACDALDAYCEAAGDAEAWAMEWAAQAARDPEQPMPWARLARAALRGGDWPGFLNAAQRLVAATLPDHPQRAWLVDRVGECDAALARDVSRDSVVSGLPETLAALWNGVSLDHARNILLGIGLLEKLGFTAAAERELETLCGRMKEDGLQEPRTLELSAQLLAANGDLAGARGIYRELAAAAPEYEPGFDALSATYLDQADLEGLLGEWLEHTKRHPESVFGWIHLARAREQRREYAEAMAAYEEVSRRSRDRTGIQEAWNRVAMCRARQLVDAGDDAGADALCVRLRAGGASDPAAWDISARLRLKEDRLDDARALYRDLAGRMPDDYACFDALSATYVEREDFKGLLDEWLAYTKLHPEAAAGWIQLAQARERRQEYAEAMTAYEEALPRATDSAGIRDAWNRVAMCRARQLVDAGDDAGADALCVRVRAGGGADPSAWDISARLYLKAGRLDDARVLYRELAGRMPENYPCFDALSATYVDRGDLEGLVAEWRAFTQNHPEAHLGWFCLGLAHERRHEYEEALAAYRRGLELQPAAQGTRVALERVEAAIKR